jgi:mersacidin/lichenicidin family type 2 lantibiotic
MQSIARKALPPSFSGLFHSKRRKIMFNQDIIRAWKDDNYWESLDEQKRSQLPENPAGAIELSEKEMEIIAGGRIKLSRITICREYYIYPFMNG